VKAARTNKKHVQASQKEAAIPPGHTNTPGFMRASSLTHATEWNWRRALGFTARESIKSKRKNSPEHLLGDGHELYSSRKPTLNSSLAPLNGETLSERID
jgi:hypothetical protein